MTANEIREKYLKFFSSAPRNHAVIPSAPLVPENDPTTLFNSAGMQPLIPYLLGQPHPLGKRLTNSQKSFRSQDIDEVGDNRHMTFFEMLGNWSLGDYFKNEQLPWIFEFVTKELGLDSKRIYVSVFTGNDTVAKDEESIAIWKKLGMPDDHIFAYDAKKNWWSRSGTPEKMAAGEPGGPDSEMFYDFGEELCLHENSSYKNEKCHPNCDCGRFLEIGNSVFMQYKKLADGTLEELPQRNVDFGGGLERMNAAVNGMQDVFMTDSFLEIIETIEEYSHKKYSDGNNKSAMRIIADHLKAVTMMIKDGVIPSNKDRGYILRMLIRRSAVKMNALGGGLTPIPAFEAISESVIRMYDGIFFERSTDSETIHKVLTDELSKFGATLDKGLREVEKIQLIDGKKAFDLYQTFGFPLLITEELFKQKGQEINHDEFETEFNKHKELSRTASVGMFKGGLADHSVETTRLHTAHHLVLAALQKVIDPSIKQRGSNITVERLRMDFNFARKLTSEELKEVENLVNTKINENLSVTRVEMPRDLAEKTGAQMEFGHKYPDIVSVYLVGLKEGTNPENAQKDDYYSAEFCGGPHVSFTGELGHFTIDKEESASAGVRRIYGHLNHEDSGSTTTTVPQK